MQYKIKIFFKKFRLKAAYIRMFCLVPGNCVLLWVLWWKSLRNTESHGSIQIILCLFFPQFCIKRKML